VGEVGSSSRNTLGGIAWSNEGFAEGDRKGCTGAREGEKKSGHHSKGNAFTPWGTLLVVEGGRVRRDWGYQRGGHRTLIGRIVDYGITIRLLPIWGG